MSEKKKQEQEKNESLQAGLPGQNLSEIEL